ncbi:response regulator [Candidatus Peregrinibacteria bacterium]|nr:response regulator [Candidatus Peregrinibacteria bacterium]
MAKKILVIDDEELIIKSLERLLNKEGFTVTVAENGAEAVERVRDIDFDLVITDVKMPDMDGIETLKKIREARRQMNKEVMPEIVVTGFADPDKFEEAIALDVTQYIFKPFDNAALLNAVKKALGGT